MLRDPADFGKKPAFEIFGEGFRGWNAAAGLICRVNLWIV